MTGTTTATLAVHLRYFAAAQEAAGTAAEALALPAGATGEDLVAAVRAAHGGGMDRVLAISSLLVDGVVLDDRAAPLGAASEDGEVRVDVLPPFAGG